MVRSNEGLFIVLIFLFSILTSLQREREPPVLFFFCCCVYPSCLAPSVLHGFKNPTHFFPHYSTVFHAFVYVYARKEEREKEKKRSSETKNFFLFPYLTENRNVFYFSLTFSCAGLL